MENPEEFIKWLDKMLSDAEIGLNMTNASLAYLLIQRGLSYYLKDVSGRKVKNDT